MVDDGLSHRICHPDEDLLILKRRLRFVCVGHMSPLVFFSSIIIIIIDGFMSVVLNAIIKSFQALSVSRLDVENQTIG